MTDDVYELFKILEDRVSNNSFIFYRMEYQLVSLTNSHFRLFEKPLQICCLFIFSNFNK